MSDRLQWLSYTRSQSYDRSTYQENAGYIDESTQEEPWASTFDGKTYYYIVWCDAIDIYQLPS